MKVLIVAKTRRGAGACVGGITVDGRSVRLVAADAANEHAGLEYEVGDIWEVESAPDESILPPHVENIIVHRAWLKDRSPAPEKAIFRLMPPIAGSPDRLFDGRLQVSPSGALYIAERTGLPGASTLFWTPDQPLALDFEGKRIRYRYPTPDGGRTLTFVGFQEPMAIIPAGTLLRVSLAHWWRPREKPDDELRCYGQLSGWFPCQGRSSHAPPVLSTRTAEPVPAGMGKAGPGEQVRPAPAVPPDMRQAREAMHRTFGFAEFLPVQGDVVARVLEGRHTLAVMPTGGGKSLCYQLPALLLDGLTVVVSPLIALMQDQVAQISRFGIPAAFLNCTVRHSDYIAINNRVRHGELKLLYVAPETLLRPETLLLLDQSRVRRLAVDEAHCISEWGHDFRPEYRHLQEVRRRFPQAACLALTATATGRVREDIRRLLAIPADGEFVASFNRPNLFLSAELRQDDGLAQVLAFLEQRRGQGGIIYCGTRRQVEALSAALNANGWPALPYHAGLEDTVRCRNQERFMCDEMPIMVATIAFGLGINKSNVRFVLHFNLPKDLDSYYQEIGRAGRDGLPADCLLLHSRRDAIVHSRFIEKGAETQRAGRKARLNALVGFADTSGCRRVPLLGYFGERQAPPCGRCDNCVPALKDGKLAYVIGAARKLFSHLIRPITRKRCDEIAERFAAGHTLEQIARNYAIQPETVITNLHRFHQGGGQLDARRLLAWSRLPEPDQRRVLETFHRLGMDRLAPIHGALSGTVDYGELHLLRLYALCRGRASDQPAHSAAGAGNSRPISPHR